ncbi:hypothetical protein ABZ714_08720 [Streptomyces sp. NPDC006798]|uniref:hypothetical protein n=1 Tax=Streptomyces sp. NPDC006798 TaxID=3155462 RepID=UPI00340AC9AC
MTIRSVWHAPTGQTQQDTRLVTSLLLTPTGELTSRGGVVPGGLNIRGTSALQCVIDPGRAVVQTTALQGAYMVAVTEPETVTIAPGTAAGDRKDLIVLAIEDSPFDLGPNTQAVIKVIQGQEAPTAPAEPQAPANSLPLYVVNVPKSAGSITWATAVENRRYPTAALGGIVPTHGFNGLYKGQYRDSGERLERWDGAAWAPYPRIPAWQDWRPTWTATAGTAPNFGNANVEGRYVQIASTVHFNFRITFGTTTTFGSGTNSNWRFSLPVRAARTVHCVGYGDVNLAEDQVPTPPDRATARIRVATLDVFELHLSSARLRGGAHSVVGIVDRTYPWTWKPTDYIVGSGTYEAAVTL